MKRKFENEKSYNKRLKIQSDNFHYDEEYVLLFDKTTQTDPTTTEEIEMSLTVAFLQIKITDIYENHTDVISLNNTKNEDMNSSFYNHFFK